jgi:hypothetical protein
LKDRPNLDEHGKTADGNKVYAVAKDSAWGGHGGKRTEENRILAFRGE